MCSYVGGLCIAPTLLPALVKAPHQGLVLLLRAKAFLVPTAAFFGVARGVRDAEVVRVVGAATRARQYVLKRGPLARGRIKGDRPVADEALAHPQLPLPGERRIGLGHTAEGISDFGFWILDLVTLHVRELS